VISSVPCCEYPRTAEPSRVNPLLSDLIGGKVWSEKPISLLFGVCFLPHMDANLGSQITEIRQFLCQKNIYSIFDKD
jgi:hypothetical protein